MISEPEVQNEESDKFDVDTDTECDIRNYDIFGRTWKHISFNENADFQNLYKNGTLTTKSENVETMDECFHLLFFFLRRNIRYSEILDIIGNKQKMETSRPMLSWDFFYLLVVFERVERYYVG